MVAKKLLAVFLGLFLISFVSAAWSVEITKLNDESVEDYYDESVEIMSFKLNNLNCTDVSQVWFSDDNGNTTSPKGCAESGGEVRLTSLKSIEGNNSWMIIVEHNDNTSENTSVDFWVDSIEPNLTYVQPWGAMYFTNEDSFYFQFGLNETNKGDYPSASFSPFKLEDIIDPFGGDFGGGNLENLSGSEETLSETKTESIPAGNLGEGGYNWTVRAKDIYPNGTTIREVNITGTIIRDVTDPNVWFNAPANNSNVSGFVWVNVSASDTNFPKNITLNISNSTYNDLVDYCEFSVDCNSHGNTSTLADGKYTITATAYDKAGNTNSTNITINIDNHAPVVDIVYPVNGTSYSSVSELNYTVNEAHPDTCWFESNYVNSGENFTGLSASEGVNTWTIYCNDTSGNIGNDSVVFIVDNTAPEVSIVSPLNPTYNTSSIVFNLSVNDYSPLDSCLLELNSASNYSMSQNGDYWDLTNSSMSQGSHTAKFYCNDSLGNLNSSEEVSFFIDSINPTISFESPPTKDNDSYVSQDYIFVNVTANDTNEDTITFALGKVNSTGEVELINESYFNDKTRAINWTGLDDGVYKYQISINDSVGNKNRTEVRTITLDTTSPVIEILAPNNNSYSNNAELNITYNLTEINPDTCWYSNDSMVVNTTLDNCTGITNVVWSEGEHNVSIWANDTLGHEDLSIISFTIDVTNPTISFTNGTETDGATVDEGEVYANITANDTNEELIIFNLYNSDRTLKDSITYFTGAREHTFTGLNDGLYYYNVTINDSAGNSASTETRNITVDKPDTSKNPSGGSSSSSSCVRVWNCSKWGRWSVCNDEGIQYRTCSEMERVGCGEGLEKDELENLVQNQSCSLKIIQESSGSDEEIESVEPNPEVEEDETEGSTSGITGGVIGFAKSGTGIITIGAIIALLGAWGAIHYNRKKKQVKV